MDVDVEMPVDAPASMDAVKAETTAGETTAGPAGPDGEGEQPSGASPIRNNAIFLQGVDDLNTNDIEDFMVKYYNKPFQIEWINDTSLNIVYEDPEDAFQALVSMTAPDAFNQESPIAPEQLRPTKPHPTKSEAAIEARFAFKTDQKSVGSRAKSRFYLLHGEPSRKQDLARFGTRRSKPMIYGFKGKDIISKRKREAQVGDLFPSKSPTVPLDEQMMEDLLPEKAPKRNRRRRVRKSKLPDLFASKTNGASDQSEPNQGGLSSAGPEQPAEPSNSIYQNMDY